MSAASGLGRTVHCFDYAFVAGDGLSKEERSSETDCLCAKTQSLAHVGTSRDAAIDEDFKLAVISRGGIGLSAVTEVAEALLVEARRTSPPLWKQVRSVLADLEENVERWPSSVELATTVI